MQRALQDTGRDASIVHEAAFLHIISLSPILVALMLWSKHDVLVGRRPPAASSITHRRALSCSRLSQSALSPAQLQAGHAPFCRALQGARG